MRKLFVYHVVTITPMVVLLSLYIFKVIGIGPFALLFLLYAFVLRPILDFQKLKSKGLMKENEFWKAFGLARFKYYRELMFEA